MARRQPLPSQTKQFNLPIFGIHVTISFNKEELRLLTEPGLYPDECQNGSAWRFSKGNYMGVAVWFDPKEYRPGLLTHECCHAAWFVMSCIGATATVEDNELHAYLAGYIADETDALWRSLQEKPIE